MKGGGLCMNFSDTECREQHIVTSNYCNPKVLSDFNLSAFTH